MTMDDGEAVVSMARVIPEEDEEEFDASGEEGLTEGGGPVEMSEDAEDHGEEEE